MARSLRNPVRARPSSSTPRLGIEPVANAVTEEVEAEYDGKDREPRERRHPPLFDQLASFGDHRAPFRCRGHDTEAQEGKSGERDDRVADIEGDEHDQR